MYAWYAESRQAECKSKGDMYASGNVVHYLVVEVVVEVGQEAHEVPLLVGQQVPALLLLLVEELLLVLLVLAQDVLLALLVLVELLVQHGTNVVQLQQAIRHQTCSMAAKLAHSTVGAE